MNVQGECRSRHRPGCGLSTSDARLLGRGTVSCNPHETIPIDLGSFLCQLRSSALTCTSAIGFKDTCDANNSHTSYQIVQTSSSPAIDNQGPSPKRCSLCASKRRSPCASTECRPCASKRWSLRPFNQWIHVRQINEGPGHMQCRVFVFVFRTD